MEHVSAHNRAKATQQCLSSIPTQAGIPPSGEGKCLDNSHPTPEEIRARFSPPTDRNHLKEPKTTGERTQVRLATLRVNDVPQFQYDKINLNNTPRKGDDIDLLDQLGEQGWELVTITANNIAYLKREVAPAKKQRTKARPTASAP